MRGKKDFHFEVVKTFNGEWLCVLINKAGHFRALQLADTIGEIAHNCRLGSLFDDDFDSVRRTMGRVWAI